MIFARMKQLGFLLAFVVLCNDVLFVGCEPRVKLLHVVFRHGEKVPHAEFQNYPYDPHRNHSFYPLVSGALTNEGKLREFKIGKMLRDRYDDFFGSVYWPDAIYARSTEVPRAKMSLQLVLAALFPPVDQQDWNPSLPWQPVDTVYAPYDKDLILGPENCPLWKNEYRKLLEEEEIQRVIKGHKSTMDYLTEHSGKTINTTGDVYYLYNLFREEELLNLTLPEWTKKVYPDPMKNITALYFKHRSCNTKLKRYGGGFMLAKITDDMKDLVTGSLKPPGRKAFFFSGHEANVISLSLTLGTKEPELPDYGSTIIIETLEDGGKHFVRLRLWTGVTEQLITQNIPDCNEICPLEEFLRLLKNVIPDDCERQCAVPSKHHHKNSGSGSTFSTEYVRLIMALGGLTIIVSKK